jgi:rubrerythrin
LSQLLFAEHARMNGHPELADLFEKTALVERFEHLAEEAELFGLVGSEGESYEVETMCREFAELDAANGDQAAAGSFAEVLGHEIGRRDA